MTYTGRCACGAITARVEGEPVAVRQCWCRQCQQVAAGNACTNAMFPTDAITLTGELSSHSYVAASGNTIHHGFCGQCGTPVWAHAEARPHFRTLRFGFLDDDHGLRPQMAIWLDDAPAWAVIDPALEHYPRQPPAPPPPPES